MILIDYLDDVVAFFSSDTPLDIFELHRLITTPFTFLMGNLLMYGIGSLLRGRGLNTTPLESFRSFSYLIAIVTTPSYVLYELITLVPYAGNCLAGLIAIYGWYLTRFAVQVALQLEVRRAWGVVILYLLILIALALTVVAIVRSM